MSAAKLKGSGNSIGSTLMLPILLLCACAPKGEALPADYQGTWVGSAGELRILTLHDGGNGSTVGSVNYLGKYFCQYTLVYDEGAADEEGVELKSKQLFCSNSKYFASRRLQLQVIGTDKLLVDDMLEEGGKASHVLDREDDGTPAEGSCKLSPKEKLKASLEKKCKKVKKG